MEPKSVQLAPSGRRRAQVETFLAPKPKIRPSGSGGVKQKWSGGHSTSEKHDMADVTSCSGGIGLTRWDAARAAARRAANVAITVAMKWAMVQSVANWFCGEALGRRATCSSALVLHRDGSGGGLQLGCRRGTFSWHMRIGRDEEILQTQKLNCLLTLEDCSHFLQVAVSYARFVPHAGS
ncbi:hypothetical protein FGB62_62g242 [Gracilaria domingensis]|nr:hypothetical protein FGB62_62g242 [Gracilaria domingensis]